MSEVGSPGRASGVARLLIRRARLAAGLAVLLAFGTLALVPNPPDYGILWMLDLPQRATSLAPDVIAGTVTLLALLTLVASIGLAAPGWLRFGVVLVSVAVLVAVVLSTGGPRGIVGPCVLGPCPALLGAVGSSAAVWVATLVTCVACWVTAGLFRGARPQG